MGPIDVLPYREVLAIQQILCRALQMVRSGIGAETASKKTICREPLQKNFSINHHHHSHHYHHFLPYFALAKPGHPPGFSRQRPPWLLIIRYSSQPGHCDERLDLTKHATPAIVSSHSPPLPEHKAEAATAKAICDNSFSVILNGLDLPRIRVPVAHCRS